MRVTERSEVKLKILSIEKDQVEIQVENNPSVVLGPYDTLNLTMSIDTFPASYPVFGKE